MIENVGDQRSFIEQSSANFLDRIQSKVADTIQDKSAKVAEKAADIVRTSKSRTVRAGASVVSFVATMINEQKANDAALGMISWFNKHDGLNPIKEFVADIVGRTK